MGKYLNAAVTDIGHPGGPDFNVLNLESNVMAQNDNTAPDDSEKSDSGSENKGSESESKSTTDDKDNSVKTKSKPLKPFVPSEKIPGEQAVDFPVDIWKREGGRFARQL